MNGPRAKTRSSLPKTAWNATDMAKLAELVRAHNLPVLSTHTHHKRLAGLAAVRRIREEKPEPGRYLLVKGSSGMSIAILDSITIPAELRVKIAVEGRENFEGRELPVISRETADSVGARVFQVISPDGKPCTYLEVFSSPGSWEESIVAYLNYERNADQFFRALGSLPGSNPTFFLTAPDARSDFLELDKERGFNLIGRPDVWIAESRNGHFLVPQIALDNPADRPRVELLTALERSNAVLSIGGHFGACLHSTRFDLNLVRQEKARAGFGKLSLFENSRLTFPE